MNVDESNIQVLFFQQIKAQLPAHLSMVDEIADILSISNDSAYRRIRGEKPISFEELYQLCSHFKLSVDQFLHLKNDSVIFNGRLVDNASFNFEEYLKGILAQMQFFNSFGKRELVYLCKDMPMFHHCLFPELGAFKFFFWIKSVLQYPEFAKVNFSIKALSDTVLETTRKIGEEYTILPSQEIWNIESIHATIRQVDYYKNTGSFASNSDLERILNCLAEAVDHIEQEAELGYKFYPEDPRKIRKAPYKIYVNEFILGDNTIFITLDETRLTYINHSAINIMFTRDPAFNEYMHQYILKMIKKSTLISEVGEKERTRFFNNIREKINSRKNALLH